MTPFLVVVRSESDAYYARSCDWKDSAPFTRYVGDAATFATRASAQAVASRLQRAFASARVTVEAAQ